RSSPIRSRFPLQRLEARPTIQTQHTTADCSTTAGSLSQLPAERSQSQDTQTSSKSSSRSLESTTSPSTKSASGSGPRANKWRLHKTIKRGPDYRPIEDEDIRYAWACYKQSGMRGFPEGLAADAFKLEFEK